MLLLGVAVADITPEWPLDLCGFMSRTGQWTDMRSRLETQVFVFGEVEDGASVARSVLVCSDLVWWGPDLVRDLKARLARSLGIPPAAVLLHATHTHGGPAMSALFSPLIGRPDPAYMASTLETVQRTSLVASRSLEPVLVRRGRATAGIGVNRRLVRDGACVMAPNPAGPIDREVTTVRFVRADGSTAGLFVHFACHPSVCADRSISADYPGAMRLHLRKTSDADAPIGFLQGCSGDVRANLAVRGEFRDGTNADVDRLGRLVARSVQSALGEDELIECGSISHARSVVDLKVARPDRSLLRKLAPSAGIVGEWSRRLLASPDGSPSSVQLELSSIVLGRQLRFIGFNAEVSVEYGLYIKRRSGGSTLPLGYTNGMIGYLVTAQQLVEGGYEPLESYRYLYRAGPFTSDVETAVKSKIDASVPSVLKWQR